MVDNQTRLVDMTLGQLKPILIEIFKDLGGNITPSKKDEKIIYGLDELGELLGCGRAKASKLVNAGVFGDALFRVGRKIRIDESKAMQAYKDYYKKQREGII